MRDGCERAAVGAAALFAFSDLVNCRRLVGRAEFAIGPSLGGRQVRVIGRHEQPDGRAEQRQRHADADGRDIASSRRSLRFTMTATMADLVSTR